MSASYLKCDIQTWKHNIRNLMIFLTHERTTVRCGIFLHNYLRGRHVTCFHYFIKFITLCPWKKTLNSNQFNHIVRYRLKRKSETPSIHFSQCFPVSPSLQWHCCHDQWSTHVPPCWQGLVVQAPSNRGHLKQIREEDTEVPAYKQAEQVCWKGSRVWMIFSFFLPEVQKLRGFSSQTADVSKQITTFSIQL